MLLKSSRKNVLLKKYITFTSFLYKVSVFMNKVSVREHFEGVPVPGVKWQVREPLSC